MSTTIEAKEVAANFSNRRVFIDELPLPPEAVPQDVSYEQYSSIIPMTGFGEVSLTSGFAQFISGFKDSLEKGVLGEFISANVSADYSNVFKVKGNDMTLKTEADKRITSQHSQPFLAQIDAKLYDFADKVQISNQPNIYKREYQKTIESQLRFTETARNVVTPEFTRMQKSSEEWADFIDVAKSAERGEIVLKYEDVARETLIKDHQSRLEKSETQIPVRKALEFWNLNPAEEAYIQVNSIGNDDLDLEPETGARLFEALLRRMGDNNWRVVRDDSTAVQVIPRAETLNFPTNRRLKGNDVKWIPSHELFHVARAMNGKRQGLKLLGTEDTYNYLATEEGSGAVAEMVAGQKFGDERQAKMAARYFAVSMMLKSDVKNGRIEARYAPQEVYNQLKEFGVSHIDASDIIWRIQRGTTLKHQGVLLPVKKDDGIAEVTAAECFVKDAVYFEGQMQVFEWIKSLMPLFEKARTNVTLGSPDFNDDLLKRVGYASERVEIGRKLSLTELKQVYKGLADIGRDQLFEILNILGRGKMRLDFLTNDRMHWGGLIANTGLTDYRRIFTPLD